jgi:parallel beta-helix repeat protein
MRPRAVPALVVLALLTGVAGAEPVLPRLVGRVAPDSTAIGCDQAATRPTLTASAHLDPSCTYTGGFQIEASNVVLDCRGAHVVGADLDGRGIHVRTDAGVALENVVVRNCVVEGFSNGIRVTRQGFKDLAAGQEYLTPTRNVVVQDVRVLNTRASGIFVDGYVTGVTLRDVEVAGAGSVGVYLEAGSKDNVVTRSWIHDNGWGQVSDAGVPILIGGTEVRYHHTGREGIAVDGSRDNRIFRNRITGNAAGGIFLYKNCGEDASSNGWWTRRYGADGNAIYRNTLADGPNGIWIGSRMAENLVFMDCSDPPYVVSGPTVIVEDLAKANSVRRNDLSGFTHAIRVEDDGNRIERNRITGATATDTAVIVGTKYRTTVLSRPVTGTVVRSNRADVPGNATPFTWIHGHVGTTFTGNRANGAIAALAPGVQPPIDPFLFAKDVFIP